MWCGDIRKLAQYLAQPSYIRFPGSVRTQATRIGDRTRRVAGRRCRQSRRNFSIRRYPEHQPQISIGVHSRRWPCDGEYRRRWARMYIAALRIAASPFRKCVARPVGSLDSASVSEHIANRPRRPRQKVYEIGGTESGMLPISAIA